MRSKLLYILLFFFLSVYEIVSMARVAYQRLEIQLQGHFIRFFEQQFFAEVAIVLFFLFAIIFIFINGKNNIPNYHGVTRKMFVFYLYFYVVTIICSLFYPFSTISTYATIIVPLLTFVFFSIMTPSVGRKTIEKSVFVLFVFLVYGYYVTYNIRAVEIIKQVDSISNTSYFLVYLLPFVLCFKNVRVKVVAILITFIVCVSSFKRGSTICLAVGVILYFYEINRSVSKNRNSFRTPLLAFLIILGMFSIISRFSQYSEGFLTERFTSMAEDRGTHRLDIYWVTTKMIFSSNILQLVFGHGWNMVVADSPMGYSAHNDFLEILYDAGIIGFVLFIVFIVRLFRWFNYLHNINSPFAAPLLASLGIFMFGMMFSHIVIYPYYFLLLCAGWGYMYNNPENQLVYK